MRRRPVHDKNGGASQRGCRGGLFKVAISEARKNLSNSGQKNLRFELAKAESLHFPNETFDLVTCRRGPVTDRKTSLWEAPRVLKRQGTLLEITIGGAGEGESDRDIRWGADVGVARSCCTER